MVQPRAASRSRKWRQITRHIALNTGVSHSLAPVLSSCFSSQFLFPYISLRQNLLQDRCPQPEENWLVRVSKIRRSSAHTTALVRKSPLLSTAWKIISKCFWLCDSTLIYPSSLISFNLVKPLLISSKHLWFILIHSAPWKLFSTSRHPRFHLLKLYPLLRSTTNDSYSRNPSSLPHESAKVRVSCL